MEKFQKLFLCVYTAFMESEELFSCIKVRHDNTEKKIAKQR